MFIYGEEKFNGYNVPLRPNLYLGTIGLDKTTITNLFERHEPFPEPVINNLIPDWQTLNYFSPESFTISAISNKKVKITSDHYTLIIGNQGTRPFEKITIHLGSKETPNLVNMSVDSLRNRLEAIREELREYCKFDFEFDPNTMRIYEAEVNVTMPLEHALDSYRRIVDLMASLHKEKAVHEKEDKFETYYMNGKRSQKIKLYSKSKEIEDLTGHFDCEVDLMRYEMTVTEQRFCFSVANTSRTTHQAESEDNERKFYLRDLTQESLEQFFLSENIDMFNAMDKTLYDDSLSNVKLSKHLDTIINRALLSSLRTDSSSFIESILLHYMNIEKNDEHRPILLDIVDLKKIIDESYFEQNIKDLLNSCLDDIITSPQKYNEVCKDFIEQRSRYEELRNKLCSKILHPMSQFVENGSTTLIYWLNKKHKEPDYSWPGSIYYYLHEVLNKPKPNPNNHVMITNNKQPRIYARWEYEKNHYMLALFDDATIKNCQHKADTYNPFAQSYPSTFNTKAITNNNTYNKPIDLPF